MPNQQLNDFVPWIIKTLGRKKFYLIGANYIYPKETNREVKALLKKHGGTAVAEEYSPLGSTEFATNINKIASSGCELFLRPGRRPGRGILQAVQGIWYHRQRHPDLHADHHRTGNRGDGTRERAGPLHIVRLFPERRHAGKPFVRQRYKAKYGKNAVTNAVMEYAYFQTYFLAQAIAKVKSTDADALIFEGLPGQEFLAPEGR